MMAQKDESEPIPVPRRDAGHRAPQMLENYGVQGDNLPQGVEEITPGSADGYEVYGFMRDLILEGKVAKWVNNSGRYVLDWSRALDRYADYEAKKNPLFKRTNQRRGKASKRLRKALLNVHKKDGAKEYMESKKVNEKGQVVERQFQMPPRVFQSLFRNAELSDSGEEQDEQERMRHLSEGAVEAQVSPESSSDAGFEETMDLSCGILIQGLPVPHSGNDLMRSMEDIQQKIATIVYRAGTKDGPSLDSDPNINEAWLVTNPKLYFPLDQDQLPESCKEHLEGIFLWEADVSTLGEGLTSPYDGVIKVEQNDSNYKCTPKEIKTLLKSLKWQKTTVPQCSGGLSLMDLSPLVQAVIVYMKDHYPTTPEKLNFHAELKAASQWYWLKENGNTSALKKVPADDCRLKIAVSETLKTWEKEREDLEAKEQRTDDSDEELSDAREAIEVLKNYLAIGENKKVPLGILIQGLPVPQHSGNDVMRSMEDSQKISTIVYRAGTEDGPSFDSDENINEAWLVTNPKLYFPLGQDLSESCKKRLEGIVLWEADVSTLGDGLTYPYDGVIKVELNDSRNSKCASKEIKKLLKSLKWRQTTVPKCSGGLSLMDLSPLVQAVVVYMKDHYPTNPEELNFHAELKAASQWYWLKGNGNTSAMKKVPADDCRLKIAVRETLKTWEKEKEDLEAKEQRTDDSDEELSDTTEAIEVLKNYLGESKKDTLQGLSKLRPTFPHFVSRKTDELSRIVEWIDPKNKQYQGVFIYGAPGIGKTTLATEAANKLRNDNRHVLVACIDCMEIKSFESFAATVIEQISRSPAVDDPAAELKKRLVASKDYFYILFLDNFECFLEENNSPSENQPKCGEKVNSFIDEIAKCPTNIKFLVTSREKVPSLSMLAMKAIHLHPFDEDESSKLLEKVRCGEKISDEQSEDLCEICSGIPLVLHTLMSSHEDLIGLPKYFEEAHSEERTNILQEMNTVAKEKKIEVCLNLCFQRLTPQVQLRLLGLCLYKGSFTPGKAAEIFCSPESNERNLSAIFFKLERCNLLHLQKFKDTSKYTFLTVIRKHFKLKAKQEYREEIQHARSLLIDYVISFLKATFKVFLGKNSVKSAIEEFSEEKENVMQLVEWIDKDKVDEERIKKCIDVFNVAGEMLAKVMAKYNCKNVYESLAKKCREMGDQRRRAECLTSLGIKEIFNCICTTGLCNKAIERARRCLDEADDIQTELQVNNGNSRAQCLAKLGRCLVRSGDTERGKAMIEEAIRIREAAVQTPDDHEEEGGENVCYVMLGATYNDKAVALSFENHHREAVNIRTNQVMEIYTERLGDHPFTATILNNLSINHRDLGEFEAAEEYAEQALRIRLELLADHRDTAKSLFDLGVVRKANGKFEEAEDLLEQCKTMLEKVVNDSTFEENTEKELKELKELRDVDRLLEVEQSEGQDQ